MSVSPRILHVFAMGALVLLSATPAVSQRVERTSAFLSELELAVKLHPLDPKARVTLGLAYWDRDDYAHALETFRQAVKVGPNSAEAHNWLGVALMGKADLAGAVAEFKKTLSLNPKFVRAHVNLGSALARSGDLGESIKAFRNALALEPNNLAAHSNLGLALRETGDSTGALVHLRRVAKAQPNDANVQYQIGQTLRQSGELAPAVAAFEKALQIDPELREAYYGLGLALKQQSASRRKPLPPLHSAANEPYERAKEAVARGDLPAARAQLTEALRLDENSAEAHNLLGFVLGQQGDMSSALVHLQRAITLQPESSEAHYNLGVALWYSGAKEKAISELRESVRLDPAAGPTHAFLGLALRESGDLAGARVSLQRGIALLPQLPATYVDLGIAFLRSGDLNHALGQLEAGLNVPAPLPPTPDWERAISTLRNGLAKNTASAEGHNVLALLLGRKGADTKEVIAQFREAIRLRPDYSEAHNNLGLVLIQANDDEAAIAEFREAIRFNPAYGDAHANLGAALTNTDSQEAVRELEKAVELAPASVKAQFNLAIAYAANANYGSAKQIEQLRKVISMAPNFVPAHLALGKALVQDRKVPEAIEELQEAARLEPQNGEAHYQLGLALARAGRKEEADTELKKGRELVSVNDRNQNANLDIAEGRAALEQEDIDSAVAKFRHAVKVQPEAAEAHRSLGLGLEKQHDIAAATAEYRKTLELNPADLATKQKLEALQRPVSPDDDPERVAQFEGDIRQGRFKEVEPLLAAYLEQHPKSSWGWYALGYSQFAQQKIGESLQALAKSLQLDVKNGEAHKILGRDLMLIGRFDAAQIEFEQGIRYSPESAEMHYNLGKLFSIQDDWEPARKQFEEALRIDPSYLEALDARGLTQEALGDDTGAVASYQKAIALNDERKGKFGSAHVNLSAYYNRTGAADKALEYANKAIELEPQSDRAWFQKAKAQERQGHLDAAVDSLTRAISFNTRASSYYYVLAGLYRRLGKMKDSQEALDVFTRLEKETAKLDRMRRSAAKSPGSVPPPGEQRE
jgi:tetratricopeptide (TPR) repeat protein